MNRDISGNTDISIFIPKFKIETNYLFEKYKFCKKMEYYRNMYDEKC